jgi:hypothetical protein
MSAHFSKFLLNTYGGTPYFQAHVPEGYPLSRVLQKSRAFRRLPPRLRELAGLAKRWAIRNSPFPAGIVDIEQWYDASGNELEPGTGRRLTDAEIDAQWLPDATLATFVAKDVPLPPGGFADPDEWESPPADADKDANLVDRGGLTEAHVLDHVASRGREATAKEYGVPVDQLAHAKTDKDLARMVLDMDGKPWPKRDDDEDEGRKLSPEESGLLAAAMLKAAEKGDRLAVERLKAIGQFPGAVSEIVAEGDKK